MQIKWKPYFESRGPERNQEYFFTDTDNTDDSDTDTFNIFDPNDGEWHPFEDPDSIFECSVDWEDETYELTEHGFKSTPKSIEEYDNSPNILHDSKLTDNADSLKLGRDMNDALRFIDSVLSGKPAKIWTLTRPILYECESELYFDGQYFYFILFEDGTAFEMFKILASEKHKKDLEKIKNDMLNFDPLKSLGRLRRTELLYSDNDNDNVNDI